MKIVNVVITGASRGLGLQFVKEFARLPEPPRHIVAACRHKSEELGTLAAVYENIHVLQLGIRKESATPRLRGHILARPTDVLDDGQYSRFVDEIQSIIGDSGINLLINNAGICDLTVCNIQDVSKDAMLSHFETNVVGPVLLTKAMLPLLQKAVLESRARENSTAPAAVVLNVSSMMGCSHHTRVMPFYMPYRVSKAALNKATHCLSFELEPEEIAVVAIHPGMVRTDMGAKDAPMEAEDSVRQMLSNVVLKLTKFHSGKLFNYDGAEIVF